MDEGSTGCPDHIDVRKGDRNIVHEGSRSSELVVAVQHIRRVEVEESEVFVSWADRARLAAIGNHLHSDHWLVEVVRLASAYPRFAEQIVDPGCI